MGLGLREGGLLRWEQVKGFPHQRCGESQRLCLAPPIRQGSTWTHL